ncbi:MAG: DNA polymerase III subunit delta [Maricaulaceae bacterium]
MKLTGGRVNGFLARPPEDIIGVLFFGPDGGLVKERSRAMLQHFCDTPDDPFSTTIITADDLVGDPAKLADEMSALSFLGGRRLVRLRLDHERMGAAISKIIKSFDIDPQKCEARLIVEAGDLSARSAIRKAFEAAGHFASIGCYADSARDVANIIRTSLSEAGLSIGADAVNMWTPLLTGNRAIARNEIEKMLLYKGDGVDGKSEVSIDDIKAIAADGFSSSIDDILSSFCLGNLSKGDQQYQKAVMGKMNPAVILRALQRHIARLMEAQNIVRSGESADNAIKALRPPVFFAQKGAFKRQLQIWPERALQSALTQSLETERQVKTAGSPQDILVGRLLLALGQYAQKRNR